MQLAILFQVLSGFVLFVPYDFIGVQLMWFFSALAYWVGVAMVFWKRRKNPTQGDIDFIRWGSVLLFTMVSPLVAYLVLEGEKWL